MGDDSCSRGCRFKSRYWWIFFTLICCKDYLVCLKRPKIKKKRLGMAHFFKKMYRNPFLCLVSQDNGSLPAPLWGLGSLQIIDAFVYLVDFGLSIRTLVFRINRWNKSKFIAADQSPLYCGFDIGSDFATIQGCICTSKMSLQIGRATPCDLIVVLNRQFPSKLLFLHRHKYNRWTQIAHKVDCTQDCHLFLSTKHPHLPSL